MPKQYSGHTSVERIPLIVASSTEALAGITKYSEFSAFAEAREYRQSSSVWLQLSALSAYATGYRNATRVGFKTRTDFEPFMYNLEGTALREPLPRKPKEYPKAYIENAGLYDAINRPDEIFVQGLGQVGLNLVNLYLNEAVEQTPSADASTTR